MQINNLIVGLGTFFLIISAVHLFAARTGNSLLNRLLIIPVLSRVAQNIVFLLINNNQLIHYPYYPALFRPLLFAAAPCFYLYIYCFLNDKGSLKKRDCLHFIPVFLSVIDSLFAYFSPDIDLDAVAINITNYRPYFSTVDAGILSSASYNLILHLHFMGYSVFAWRALINSGLLREKNSIEKKWLLTCLIPTSAFQILGLTLIIFAPMNQPLMVRQTVISYFIGFSCLLFLAFIVFLIHQPRLAYGYLILSGKEKSPAITITDPEPSDEEVAGTANKINLSTDQTIKYVSEINEFMETGQAFLNSKFQIIHLAHRLDIPAHHCSFIINNEIGKNFRDWVNGYRIRYFIENYNKKSDKMTIHGMAYESGFNSTTTFYRAFKKETGQMPVAYFQNKKL